MRDTRKTEAYFDAYIAYEEERIQKKTEKLVQCNDEAKVQRISCSTAQRMTVLTYEDALRMASFSVMLECQEAFQKVAERFSKVFESDRLLRGLCSFAVSGTAIWEGEYRFPAVYEDMEDVLTAQEKRGKEKALLCYLSGWYNRNKESSWYGTLNSSHDVYYGYWSFESTAMAVIYGLDQEYLAQNEYFPNL